MGKSQILVAAMLAMAAATPAAAALNGQDFIATYELPNQGTPYASGNFTPAAFVVGPGSETIGNIEDVTFLDVDFGDNSLRIDFDTRLSNPTFNVLNFNGPVFRSTSALNIGAVSIGAGSNFAGFGVDRVLISGNTLALNFNGLSYDDDTVLSLDFAAVPEPATWALLLVGFGLTGVTVRRRRVVLA